MEFSASPLVVRVGVVSAANIAKKNARAILRSERCALVAVASRSLEKARAWRAALGLGDDVECVEGYAPRPRGGGGEGRVEASRRRRCDRPVARGSPRNRPRRGERSG